MSSSMSCSSSPIRTSMTNRLYISGAVLLAAVLVASALVFGKPVPASSQSGTPVTGYLWSDTIGWISMNCSNTSTCATSNYSVAIDTSGNLSGYAWSDNVGWVKFGGLSSFPTGSGTVAQNAAMASTSLLGWARACAGTASGDCSSMTSRTDGWDGWIALSGTSFGVSLTGGSFSGYAWGGENVGWIDFSAAPTTYLPCAATQGYVCSADTSVHTAADCAVTNDYCPSHGAGWFCSTDNGICTAPPAPEVGTNLDGSNGALSTKPSLVKSGGTTKVIWTIDNANTCTVVGSNGDSWSGTASIEGGYTSSPITQRTTYTIDCTGDGGTLHDTTDTALIPEWQEK